ncbi:MAG: type I restriction endonuclease, partial [Desulfoprunum sp.]
PLHWDRIDISAVTKSQFHPVESIFINGLPMAVMELKNAATGNATIWAAFNQLQTYKTQIPSLFAYNEAFVISDGVQARIGTLTAPRVVHAVADHRRRGTGGYKAATTPGGP